MRLHTFAPLRFLIRTFLVAALGIGLLALPVQGQSRSDQGDRPDVQERQIIDVHLHALSPSFYPEEVDSLVGYERAESGQAVLRQTIEQLERFNVTTAVTSGTPELLNSYQQAAPDRIIRSLWVPIGLTGEELSTYLDSLSVWHEQGRFEVIGEVLTQYSGIAPSDPVLDSLWAFAEREGVPVGVHAGPGGLTPNYRVRHGNPLAFEEVLAEHPNLKLYLMHAGYPLLNEMIALLNAYPQVYVGLGFLPIAPPQAEFDRYIRGLVRAGHADRILFGSDQQVWPQSYEASVDAVENADFLTEEQKQDIFYDNAARFFGLERQGMGVSQR